MSTLQKFVMVPADKYKRLIESRESVEKLHPKESKDLLETSDERNEETPPPPPGLPEERAEKRWLTLPEEVQ